MVKCLPGLTNRIILVISCTNHPSVVRALNGIIPDIDPYVWRELWTIDNQLFQVATVPLYYDDYRIKLDQFR